MGVGVGWLELFLAVRSARAVLGACNFYAGALAAALGPHPLQKVGRPLT